MASRVFSVGMRFPGDIAEYVPLRSGNSLFDGDVILFYPHFGNYTSSERYAGHRLLTETDSAAVIRDTAHWRSELKTAVDSGKIVFVYLRQPEQVYYYTGSQSYSGTGRSRVTTNHVASVESYHMLPITLNGLTPRRGREISPIGSLGALAAYWSEFGSVSKYEAYYDSGVGTDVLGTKKREKIVGSIIRTKGGGALVLLPPFEWDEDELTYYRGDTEYWRKEAQRLGARWVKALIGASDALRKSGKKTPTPEWVLSSDYALETAEALQQEIDSTDAKMERLAKTRERLQEELEEARVLHGLLFESGAPLEHSILKALRLLGFEASGYKEGESEFDAVFTSPEGRFLGEAEGKESKAINIDKMSQLERNLQEDFARDEVDTYAKGVLFGNAFRFASLSEREEFFTPKCVSAAKRLGIALVRTPDLFEAARYLAKSNDPVYAEACRRAIFEAKGDVVSFPEVPGHSKEQKTAKES
jgi:hypothetical protein